VFPEIHGYIMVVNEIFHKKRASMQISEGAYRIKENYLAMFLSEYNKFPDPDNAQ
jgi:hypothetical protein